MGLDEPGEEVHPGAAEVRSGRVDPEHRVQALGLLVDGEEPGIPQHVGPVGRQHPAHEPQLPHPAAKLEGGRLGVLDREQRHRTEPGADPDELLGQEGVVRAAEGDGPLPVLEEAHEEPERRVEDRRLHAATVEGLEPGGGIPGPVAETAQETAVPAVGGVPGERERTPPVGLVQVLRHLLGRLRDVAVAVDHPIRRHAPPPPAPTNASSIPSAQIRRAVMARRRASRPRACSSSVTASFEMMRTARSAWSASTSMCT